MNQYISPTPEEIEQWNQENREALKELSIYYGSWDKLRKVIDDIEQDEAEASYDHFVENYYGSPNLQQEERWRMLEAQKLK